MAGKMPRDVRNDLFFVDISAKLPCSKKSDCALASDGCDHFASHECPVADAVFLPNFASCPFLGRGVSPERLKQMATIDCGACRACEGKNPSKIYAVCRSLCIDGQWTGQKFSGIQTAIPYVFCDACRIHSQL